MIPKSCTSIAAQKCLSTLRTQKKAGGYISPGIEEVKANTGVVLRGFHRFPETGQLFEIEKLIIKMLSAKITYLTTWIVY